MIDIRIGVAAVAFAGVAACSPAAPAEHAASQPTASTPPVSTASQITTETRANERLEGGWYAAATEAMWTFKREGYLGIAQGKDGFLWAVLKFGGDAQTVEFIDLSAPPVAAKTVDCAMSSKGVYSYAIADGTLTLTRVEDPCEPRRTRLNGIQLHRIETPVQPGSE